MPDPIDQPYVVTFRERRIDIAGPFEVVEHAKFWGQTWSQMYPGSPAWHVVSLPPTCPFAILAYPMPSVTGMARFCAPGRLSRWETTAWAVTHETALADGFPTESLPEMGERFTP